MPQSTSNLRPVIVYLPKADYEYLERRAGLSASSMSSVVRAIVHRAVAASMQAEHAAGNRQVQKTA
jgi:hypothetical protein